MASGRVKFNVDASLLDGVGGTGMILRDDSSKIIHLLISDDLLEAEILAMICWKLKFSESAFC